MTNLGAAVTLVCVAGCGARTELSARAGVVLPDAGPDVRSIDARNDAADRPDFAWYVLDETSGTTAHDSSSNHYDVTNLAGVAWNAGAIFGGTTCGEVDVAGAFRDPPTTITAWLAPALRDDATANSYALLPFPPNALSGDIPGAGGYGIGVDVWSDGAGGSMVTVETGIGDTTAFHALTDAFSSGTESFVAVVSSASSSTIYVDGAELAAESANDPPNADPTPLWLGCHNADTGYGTKRFYKGRMRDARVYKRSLGAPEIAQLYAAGPVTKAP